MKLKTFKNEYNEEFIAIGSIGCYNIDKIEYNNFCSSYNMLSSFINDEKIVDDKIINYLHEYIENIKPFPNKLKYSNFQSRNLSELLMFYRKDYTEHYYELLEFKFIFYNYNDRIDLIIKKYIAEKDSVNEKICLLQYENYESNDFKIIEKLIFEFYLHELNKEIGYDTLSLEKENITEDKIDIVDDLFNTIINENYMNHKDILSIYKRIIDDESKSFCRNPKVLSYYLELIFKNICFPDHYLEANYYYKYLLGYYNKNKSDFIDFMNLIEKIKNNRFEYTKKILKAIDIFIIKNYDYFYKTEKFYLKYINDEEKLRKKFLNKKFNSYYLNYIKSLLIYVNENNMSFSKEVYTEVYNKSKHDFQGIEKFGYLLEKFYFYNDIINTSKVLKDLNSKKRGRKKWECMKYL